MTDKIKTMTLHEISNTHKTDKNFEHNFYRRVYDNELINIKETATKVCEIGVRGLWEDIGWSNGNSLRVWRDYFTNAEVLGLDIDTSGFDSLGERISVDYIDQSNKDQVVKYSTNLVDYDLIIDDGSHRMYDQQITFAYFFKSLKSGGIYILEDLHTSPEVNIPEKNRIWSWGEPGKITTLEMLKTFTEDTTIVSDYLTVEEKNYLKVNIESVNVYDEKPGSYTSIIVKK